MSNNKTILVIEDETLIRHLLVRELESEGYTVLEAKNGKAGHEQALKHHPQLVLLDIIMPIMNGIDMLKLLRKDKWGKMAQVILLTNLDSSEGIKEAEDFGVSDYIVKADWSMDDLAQKVKEKLKPLAS
jgi:DNA-binding response OmpR family regulator